MAEFLIWLLIGVLCLITEVFTLTTFFLFVAIAMIAMSAVTYVFPNMQMVYQSICFFVLVIFVLYLFYRYSLIKKTKDMGKRDQVNDRMSIYVGRQSQALEHAKSGITKIKLGDTVWRAKVDDAKVGDVLKVVSYESTSLICENISK